MESWDDAITYRDCSKVCPNTFCSPNTRGYGTSAVALPQPGSARSAKMVAVNICFNINFNNTSRFMVSISFPVPGLVDRGTRPRNRCLLIGKIQCPKSYLGSPVLSNPFVEQGLHELGSAIGGYFCCRSESRREFLQKLIYIL